jgi:hypothetical protein
MKTSIDIPVRTSEKPTTNSHLSYFPHLQYTQHSPRYIYNKMADWMFNSFEQSREHKSLISHPSSRAMWLAEDVKNTPDDGFMPPLHHSREFAHLHRDGSVHVCLPEADMQRVLKAKWGELHPYHLIGVNEILVYAPQNEAEIKILQQIITASYKYVTSAVYRA